MGDYDHPLAECLQRFDAIGDDLTEIKADVKHVRHVLTDDPNDSVAATLSRHRAYWKLFAILGTLAALVCTVAGTIYAAIR